MQRRKDSKKTALTIAL